MGQGSVIKGRKEVKEKEMSLISFSIFQSHQICKVYFLAQVKYLYPRVNDESIFYLFIVRKPVERDEQIVCLVYTALLFSISVADDTPFSYPSEMFHV